MMTSIELDREYSLSAPKGGGSVSLNFKTGYNEKTKFTSYIIKDESNEKEWLSIYETGLVLWVHQTPTENIFKSNKDFQLEDDENFWLVSD